ncbi:hypothetical protein J3R83DRAFT_5436 [Lanmaoa asiatica]|nr:hypothetical protein J3R83DRAFT_5436 [Lanmaoa asiatica]
MKGCWIQSLVLFSFDEWVLDSVPCLLSNTQLVDGTGAMSPLTISILHCIPQSMKFHMSYADTVSASLSTAYLFNYLMPCFAWLPIFLTMYPLICSSHWLLLHSHLSFHSSLF